MTSAVRSPPAVRKVIISPEHGGADGLPDAGHGRLQHDAVHPQPARCPDWTGKSPSSPWRPAPCGPTAGSASRLRHGRPRGQTVAPGPAAGGGAALSAGGLTRVEQLGLAWWPTAHKKRAGGTVPVARSAQGRSHLSSATLRSTIPAAVVCSRSWMDSMMASSSGRWAAKVSSRIFRSSSRVWRTASTKCRVAWPSVRS